MKHFLDKLIDDVAVAYADGDLDRVRSKLRDRAIALIEREKEEVAKDAKAKLVESQKVAGSLRLELERLEARLGSSGV